MTLRELVWMLEGRQQFDGFKLGLLRYQIATMMGTKRGSMLTPNLFNPWPMPVAKAKIKASAAFKMMKGR